MEGNSRIDIVQKLNEINYLTRRNKHWTNITLGKFFTPIMVAYYSGYPDSTRSRFTHPPLIEPSEYNWIQDKLKSLKLGKKNSNPTDYLLSNLGILKCGHCGSTVKASITKRGNTKFSYYLCTLRQVKGIARCTDSILHKQSTIDRIVLNSLPSLGKENIEQFVGKFYHNLGEFQPQIFKLQSESDLTDSNTQNLLNNLLEHLHSLIKDTEAFKAATKISALSSLPISEQRDVLKSMIKTIALFSGHIEITFNSNMFHPYEGKLRVDIPL